MNYIKLTDFNNELANQIFSYNVLQQEYEEEEQEEQDELLL